MIPEIWKSVPDWPEYEVSNLGNARRATPGRSTYVGKPLKPGINPKSGYKVVAFCRSLKPKSYNLHYVIAVTFLGPRPFPGAQVAHNDGVRTNCDLSNLRWDTPVGNASDRAKHGTLYRGKSKIKSQQIPEILNLSKQGYFDREIALSLGVSKASIRNVISGKDWSHISGIQFGTDRRLAPLSDASRKNLPPLPIKLEPCVTA